MLYNQFREHTMNKLTEILNELQVELTQLLWDKLDALYIYGSQARGEATSDSDIDVLVVIRGDYNHHELSQLVNPVESNLSLKYDTLISLIFISDHRYKNEDSPFLINVRKEAVPLHTTNTTQKTKARCEPIARLVPYQEDISKRTPGVDAGKIVIAPDFDEPLPEFEDYLTKT